MVSAFGAAGITAAFGIDGGADALSDSAVFAAGAAETVVAPAATGAAVIAEPVTDFARATGVLNSPFVEAITAAPAVAAFDALGDVVAAAVFFGGAGLNESRIFSAATASCARMCGICSNTVSAGRRSFINLGISCCRKSP